MSRLSASFACVATLLLVLGVVSSRSPAVGGITVALPRGTYLLPSHVVCFGYAAVFCIYAFAYGVWFLPWSIQAAAWHLILSLICLLLSIFGVLFLRSASFTQGSSASPSGPQQVFLALLLMAPILFVAVQLWFAVDAVRRTLQWYSHG